MYVSKRQGQPILRAAVVLGGAVLATQVSPPVMLARAASAPTEDAATLFRRGVTLQHDDKLADAAANLRAAVRQDPSLTEAYRALAEVYLQQGNHNLAFATIGNAMKAETRKGKADLTPFIKLLERVDMQRVDAKQAAVEATRIEAADLAAKRAPAEKSSKGKLNQPGQWKVGDKIDVQWKGGWYPASILATKGHSYQIHFDGYGDTWDEWVTPERIRPRTAKTTNTTAGSKLSASKLSANKPSTTQKTVAEKPSASTAPRLGKYKIFSYGSPLNPPIYLGHFVLLPQGKYRASNTSKEKYYGGGTYSFDAKSRAIKWLDGPFKRNSWSGTFEVEREGKTHKIRLTRTTIGVNELD